MSMQEGLALYIHWPFCVSKCPYCDFNSHVRPAADEDAYAAGLLQDMAYEAAQTPGKRLNSVFFGGGTPSLMSPGTVARLLAAAERHWGFSDGIEITLEANPSSVEAARFAGLSAAGVNRVSLGLQALDDTALRFFGRAHGVAESLAALDLAQRHFPRQSIDLIYARPDQSPAAWEVELTRALSFDTEHLSLYQLTIEPGTRFAALHDKGMLPTLDPDAAADLFALTRALTAAARRPAYEISNHAAPGAESRHNLAYWRYRDYAGIGPGAHGRRGGTATFRRKKPENWLAAVTRNGHGIESEETLPPAIQAQERLLMGLRLDAGISRADVMGAVDPVSVARMVALGLIANDRDRLRVTAAGMPLLDRILSEIAV